MKRIISFILLSVVLYPALCGASRSSYVEQQAQADIIRNGLANVKSAKDSIKILYDVFDLTPTYGKKDVAWTLLDVARRSGDNEALADMIRQLSVFQIREREVLDTLSLLTKNISDESLRKGTELFVNVQKASNEARFLSGNDRMKALIGYVKEDLTPKHDVYQDILDLYRVAIFIRHTAKGNMYLEYLSRLEDMINNCPENIPYLKNLFYTTAASYYTSSDLEEKALECDRKLLEIIKELEEKYKKQGRQYRNYNRNYYICYRRMLSNFEALDMDEVKDLYAKCAMLAEKDEEVRIAFDTDPRPTAYRLLAEKDYAGALPYMKKVAQVAEDSVMKARTLSYIIEAADKIGDENTKINALEEYNRMFFDSRREKSAEAVLELQMRYNVNQMRSAMADMDIQKKNLEIVTNQKIIIITLVALFLLAVGLMILYRSHFKLLNKARMLASENKKLHESLDEILNNGAPQGSTDLKTYGK